MKPRTFEQLYPNANARKIADEATDKIDQMTPLVHVCAKWLMAYEEAAGVYE